MYIVTHQNEKDNDDDNMMCPDVIVCDHDMYRLMNGIFCNERYNGTTRYVMHECA